MRVGYQLGVPRLVFLTECSLFHEVVDMLDVAMNRAEEVDGRELPNGVCLICALTAIAVSLRLRVRSRSILYGRLSHTARAPAFVSPGKTAGLDIQKVSEGFCPDCWVLYKLEDLANLNVTERTSLSIPLHD